MGDRQREEENGEELILPSFPRFTQFVWFLTHSCRSFTDPWILCSSLRPGSPCYPLTLFLPTFPCENFSLSCILFGFQEGSAFSQQRNRVNFGMNWEAMIKWDIWCTWTPRLSEFGDALEGQDWAGWEMHLEAEMEWVWRYSWRQCSFEIGGVVRECPVSWLSLLT